MTSDNAPHSIIKRWLSSLAILAALAVALEPLFLIIDRIMVFNTVPRDDYAPFLLWLVHAPGGAFPESPYGYRILTMAAAVPVYYLLPALRLTNLPPALTPQYVQATAALAALSCLSLLASGLLMYRFARDRIGLPRRDATVHGAGRGGHWPMDRRHTARPKLNLHPRPACGSCLGAASAQTCRPSPTIQASHEARVEP